MFLIAPSPVSKEKGPKRLAKSKEKDESRDREKKIAVHAP